MITSYISDTIKLFSNAGSYHSQTTTEFIFDIVNNLTTTRPKLFRSPSQQVLLQMVRSRLTNTTPSINWPNGSLRTPIQPSSNTTKTATCAFPGMPTRGSCRLSFFVTFDGLDRPLETEEVITHFAVLDVHANYTFWIWQIQFQDQCNWTFVRSFKRWFYGGIKIVNPFKYWFCIEAPLSFFPMS